MPLLDLSGAPIASTERQRIQAYRKQAARDRPGPDGAMARLTLHCGEPIEWLLAERDRGTPAHIAFSCLAGWLGQVVANIAVCFGRAPDALALELLQMCAEASKDQLQRLADGDSKNMIAIVAPDRDGRYVDADFRDQLREPPAEGGER